ncbi:hypothetical protein SAMN05428963_1053 [Consotaella salsifontis]|uniref:Transposase, Mutator family n=1 Tax=Consotaella salsifontis TaxID=1365950 RepID=A0A1T4QE74_9HYPH|nr:hypothetical protein SAMN05428963_1053 [Consotaella salsifontis]
MKKNSTVAAAPIGEAVEEAFADVQESFERFCLAAGIETLSAMMEADVEAACGPRHGRNEQRQAHRWGKMRGADGFHGGKVVSIAHGFAAQTAMRSRSRAGIGRRRRTDSVAGR